MTEESFIMQAAEILLPTLKKYKKFTGRSTRKEFWIFVLFTALGSVGLTLLNFLLMLLLFWIDPAMGDYFNFDNFFANLIHLPLLIPFALLSIVWRLGILCPAAALTVRRMHDIGKSGKFALLLAPYALLMLIYDLLPWSWNCSWIFWILTIPVAVAAGIFLYLANRESQPGRNQYDDGDEDEEAGEDGDEDDESDGDGEDAE